MKTKNQENEMIVAHKSNLLANLFVDNKVKIPELDSEKNKIINEIEDRKINVKKEQEDLLTEVENYLLFIIIPRILVVKHYHSTKNFIRFYNKTNGHFQLEIQLDQFEVHREFLKLTDIKRKGNMFHFIFDYENSIKERWLVCIKREQLREWDKFIRFANETSAIIKEREKECEIELLKELASKYPEQIELLK